MSTTPSRSDVRHADVIIVGGGHAGLSISYLLKANAIDHVILEKNRVGHTWRTQRWDSFCLVTPNWQCRLPGFPYPGDDPHGFMGTDDIIRYIEAYAALISPPIREGVAATHLQSTSDGRFRLTSTDGEYVASCVVVAISDYHEPMIPRMAERLAPDILQLHSSEYRNPHLLRPGAVLVAGSGQSGCQIAEELHQSGRTVHLAVGGAPRSPRKYRGRDAIEWFDDMGHYDLPIERHPLKEKVRAKANHYLSGRDGGHEIDLRQLALEGMRLHGRLADIRGHRLTFHDDLTRNLDAADAVYVELRATIDRYIAESGIDAPTEPPFRPVWTPDKQQLMLDCASQGISTLIWSTGFRSDFGWIEIPIFNGNGYPGHRRGVTSVEGLYFVGLPWLYTWGSGRFSGIARDAEHIADCITARVHSLTARSRLPQPSGA